MKNGDREPLTEYIDMLVTYFLNGMMAVGTFLVSFFALMKRAAAVV